MAAVSGNNLKFLQEYKWIEIGWSHFKRQNWRSRWVAEKGECGNHDSRLAAGTHWRRLHSCVILRTFAGCGRRRGSRRWLPLRRLPDFQWQRQAVAVSHFAKLTPLLTTATSCLHGYGLRTFARQAIYCSWWRLCMPAASSGGD